MDATSSMAKAYSYVRMSTDAQLKGDSLRRQLDRSADYAKLNGLELVEYNLHDIGVSAFRGANLATGALGKFVRAIESGDIEVGSYLLVESFDRLSRQDVATAMGLFLRVIGAGIVLVTLSDGHVFRPGQTSTEELMLSLLVMGRAHEESKLKSDRIAAAWANKRKAQTTVLTRIRPSWIELSGDGRQFVLNIEKADVIRRIFRDAASGLGILSIARSLNAEEIAPFSEDSRGWHPSFIAKILHNRAVLGEFQPHTRINGKRTPDGPLRLSYFPRVISENEFLAAEAGRNQRLANGRGRKGPNQANLFAGILFCRYCKGKVRYENKGPGPKGGRYLGCEAGARNYECISTRWRYEHFEAAFLHFVEEVEITSLSQNSTGDRETLALIVASSKAKLDRLVEERNRTYSVQMAAEDFDASFLSNLLRDYERRIVEATKTLARDEATYSEFLAEDRLRSQSPDLLRTLVAEIRDQSSQDSLRRRASISGRIKSIVDRIELSVVGDSFYDLGNTRRLLEESSDEFSAQILEMMNAAERDGETASPAFEVYFKSGDVRNVIVDREDPFRLVRSIARRSDRIDVIKDGESISWDSQPDEHHPPYKPD